MKGGSYVSLETLTSLPRPSQCQPYQDRRVAKLTAGPLHAGRVPGAVWLYDCQRRRRPLPPLSQFVTEKTGPHQHEGLVRDLQAYLRRVTMSSSELASNMKEDASLLFLIMIQSHREQRNSLPLSSNRHIIPRQSTHHLEPTRKPPQPVASAQWQPQSPHTSTQYPCC